MAELDRYVTVTLIDLSGRDRIPTRHLKLHSPEWSIEIGRASSSTEADFRPEVGNAWFDSRVVSRRHAVLTANPDDKTFFLRDVGSTHGTRIGGFALAKDDETGLEEDDVMTLGSSIDRGDVRFPALELKFSSIWSDDEEMETMSPQSSATQTSPKKHKSPNCFSADYTDDDQHSDSDVEYVGESQRRPSVEIVLPSVFRANSDSEDSVVSNHGSEESHTSHESPTTSPLQSKEAIQVTPASFLEMLMTTEKEVFGDISDDDDAVLEDDAPENASESEEDYTSSPAAQPKIPADLPKPLGSFPDTMLILNDIGDIEDAFDSDYDDNVSLADLGLASQSTCDDGINNSKISQPIIEISKRSLNLSFPKAPGQQPLQEITAHIDSSDVHARSDDPAIVHRQPLLFFRQPRAGQEQHLPRHLELSSLAANLDTAREEVSESTQQYISSAVDVSAQSKTLKELISGKNENENAKAGEPARHTTSSSSSRKRKANEISIDVVDENMFVLMTDNNQDTSVQQMSKDAYNVAGFDLLESKMVSAAAHRTKRQKVSETKGGSFTKYAAAVLTGMAFGVVGTVFGLAALPPDFFI